MQHSSRPFGMPTHWTTRSSSGSTARFDEVLTAAVALAVDSDPASLKDGKRQSMRVHGRTGLPCPVCGETVREVSLASRSFQYCPGCQTGGRVFADRRLSRLLR